MMLGVTDNSFFRYFHIQGTRFYLCMYIITFNFKMLSIYYSKSSFRIAVGGWQKMHG